MKPISKLTTTQTREKRTDNSLVSFIETLQSINHDKEVSKLNQMSITDNNGGRIEL